MSQYHNRFTFQSGLRNAAPEQNRQPERGSSANMPIFLEDDEPSPSLPSFQSSQRRQFTNFSSDLRSLAFAAKSSLGLCDGTPARSDALQSLMSYGPQSTQNDSPKPPQEQRNCYELGSPSRTSYNPDPGYLHPSLLSRNAQERSRQEEFFSGGSSQRPTFANEPPTPSSVKEDSQGSFASFRPMSMEQNDGSYTPFKPPPQLNTVEDEDEFLYGDSTPVPETPSSRTDEPLTHKHGKETRPNPGLGSWSDDESLFAEDISTGNQHIITIDSPASKSKEKETTSIPLKNLSWNNKHAWKDEVQVAQDFTKPHSTHITALEKPKDRSSPRAPEISVMSPQSDKKSSKYVSAALVLKKQLDSNKLTKGKDDSVGPPGAKVLDAPKESQHRGIWVNVETAGKKRVVSMAGKSQYDRDISPEPRETTEPDRALLSRYEDEDRRKIDSDKYDKNFYERKASHRPRSPLSPSRRSPDRYRSPSPGYRSRGRSRGRSPEYRSRGRSRSPEYRSRGRSRGRSPESRSRGRSRSRPRHPDEYSREKSRGRSRGRSQPKLPDNRPRQDKDGKYSGKRPHSPDDRPYRGEPAKKKPIPPSVEASLLAETPEEGGLFPKSMSQEMFSMFMKESRLDVGSKKVPTESPRSTSRFSDPSRESSGPINPYTDPSTEPLKPIEQYSDLSAEPSKPVMQFLDQAVEASKTVSRFSDPSDSPKIVNRYAEPVSESPKPTNRFAEPPKPVKQLPDPLVPLKEAEPTKLVRSKPAVPSADQHIVTQKLNFCLRLVYQTDSLNKFVADVQKDEEAKKINILAQKVELAFDANARQIQEQVKSTSHEVQHPSVPYLPHTLPPQVAPYPSVPMYPPQIPSAPPPMAQPYSYSYPPHVPSHTVPPQVPSISFPPYNPMFPPPPITNQVYPGPMVPQVDSSQVLPPTAKVVLPANTNRCLRSVPVLSPQEIKKINSKEPQDQDLVEKFNKRVDEHNLCLKKLASLSEQRVEINKIKEDFIIKSQKVRGGGDTQFLSDMEKLEDKAAAELQRTIDEMKLLSQEVQEMASMLGPQKLEQIKTAPKPSPEKKKPAVVFGCFDSGQHFCVQCSLKFTSILDTVKHLHSEKHLAHEGPTKKFDSKVPPKAEATVTSLQPAKGIEFVKPLSAFYCTLCDETLLNPLFAEQHIKGHDHTMKYMSYLRENPMYEEKHRLIVNARMAAAEKESRLKTLEEIAKARQIILKKNLESEEKLKKVQNKLKKDQSNPLEELEEAHSASADSPKKGAGIKLTLAQKEQQEKPKRQVIYIGRAPNFRPKADDKKTKDKVAKGDEDKRGEREGKTSSQSSHKQAEVKDLSRYDHKSSRENSKQEVGLAEKKKESSGEKVKVFGCKNEAESKNMKPEVESKPSSRKSTRTVQLQLDEPKTNDPAVNQALKNIMYGKSSIQGKVPDLSAIKLPDDPPLPPLPDKEPVKPKKTVNLPIVHKTPEGPRLPPQLIKDKVKPKSQLQRPVSLTEEEKDFILLGIDKSDMQPIAIPKPPPNIRDNCSPAKKIPVLVSGLTSSKCIKLPDVTVPPPKMLVPPPQVALPNLSVPPPTLQVPLPNLQVPPPNLQVPPPNLQIPRPNLQVPPPMLTVPPPNMQVPPPNLRVSSSKLLLNKTNTMPIPVYSASKCPPAETKNSTPDVDDMDIDIEEETDPKIEVGIPISGDAKNQVKVKIIKSSDSTNKSSTVTLDNSKPTPEVLRTSKSEHDIRPTAEGIKDSNVGELRDGVVKDKSICSNILSLVINTVLEKHLEIPSEISNAASITDSSSVDEPNMIDECSKNAKDISPDLITTIFSEKSCSLEKSEKHSPTESNSKEETESEGIDSLTTSIVKTSDAKQSVTSSHCTEEVSNDNEANSASLSITENISKFESEMLEKSQSSAAENLTNKNKDEEAIKEDPSSINSFNLEITSKFLNTASIADFPTANEPNMMDKCSKNAKDISPDPITTIVSEKSSALEKSEKQSTTESGTKEASENTNSFTTAIVETSDAKQSVTSSECAEEVSNDDTIEANSSLSIAENKSKFESEMLEKSSSATENLTTSKNKDEEINKEDPGKFVNNQTANLESLNIAADTKVLSLSTTAQFDFNTEEKNNETGPMPLKTSTTSQHIVEENISSVHDNPVVQEEDSSSCSELLKTPSCASVKDNTEILEENSSSLRELQKASSLKGNSEDLEESSLSYTELLNTPCGIPNMENEQKQNSSEDPINVLNYEDICEAPLIHSIEHFMDFNTDNELQQYSSSAQDLPQDSLAEQETRIQLQVEENVSISIALEKQELFNSPVESMKSTGDVLGVSSIEAMEIEETGIQNVLHEDLDLQISCPANINTPTVGSEANLPVTFKEDPSVPLVVEATGIPNSFQQDLPISCPVTDNIPAVGAEDNLPANKNTPKIGSEANLKETFKEDPSVPMVVEATEIPNSFQRGLPISCAVTENVPAFGAEVNLRKSSEEVLSIPMVVEVKEIPNVMQADLPISFLGTENTAADGAEADLLKTYKEDPSVAMTGEKEPQHISAALIVDPQIPNGENNSLYTCISGLESFDRNSCLGSEIPIESYDSSVIRKGLEENLEVMKASEENQVSMLVLENLEIDNKSPMDLEPTTNPNEIKITEDQSTPKPIFCEVNPLNEKCTEQKEFTEEVSEKATHSHAENVSEELPPNLDVHEKAQQESSEDNQLNQENSTETILTLSSYNNANESLESVLSKGCEETKLASGQAVLTKDELKLEDVPTVLCLSEDSSSRDNEGLGSAVPCLDKFDLDDSLSNSISGDPPVLSEILVKKDETTIENICQQKAVKEKKNDSETDEYDTEGGSE